tara:strand:- start:411 stop:1583 length:1173 start_codon:yes stop_codon:yes gene_type:complete
LNREDEIQKSISLAESWLLNSGIQNTDKSKDVFGSFNAWYDTLANKFSFAYSEITGYGINTLLFLNSINKNPIFIDRAKIAAEWIMDKSFEPSIGGILCRYEHDSKRYRKWICTFDNAMCLNSMINLYKTTGEKKYLDFSLKIAEWLLKMQKVDGCFFTRLLIDRNKLEENGDKWSTQSGAFHAKMALGLLNLGKLLNDSQYINAAKELCDWSLKLQTENGRFITDKNDNSTFLHPCCYANEGIIVAGIVLENKAYINSVKKCLEWIKVRRLETNGFPAYYIDDEFVHAESPDINAQVIRLLMMLDSFDIVACDYNYMGQCIENIMKYQSNSKDRRTRGGFFSGDAWFFRQTKNNAMKHANSWVTMFALQALKMYVEKKNLSRDSIFYLV